MKYHKTIPHQRKDQAGPSSSVGMPIDGVYVWSGMETSHTIDDAGSFLHAVLFLMAPRVRLLKTPNSI